ncbi:MAG: GNAT family N-acetyltransferase, partial [Acidobacteria bacterium]|nr:GNAT family N-acetyltransferase [Acidobacteriota bacterium]
MPVDPVPLTADVVALRPVSPGDESFLLEVYKSTRPEIVALGWEASQQEAFLKMQFNGQQRSYEMQYPEAAHQVILYKGAEAGRL